jgi:ABC-type multidrug transport system ATPase subunit
MVKGLIEGNESILSDFIDTDIPKVCLTWKDISYTVSKTDKKNQVLTQKEILHGVSGYALPGDFLAIMGSSGAGKTTLLNVLSSRVARNQNASVTGEVLANGKPINTISYNSYMAYVMQEDVLFETLTVWESVMFSVNLRTSLGKHEKQKRVDKILNELGLTDIKNNIIGSVLLKGISGGEKKRTSIAIELVTSPSLLFLDEPTSGLDSYTALTVVQLLKRQATHGRTIICTIHQPNSELFYMFDKLILMADGNIVYQGGASGSVEYFKQMGYQCPIESNPGDYFMQMLHLENLNNKTIEEEQKISSFTQEHKLRIASDLANLIVSDEYQELPTLRSDISAHKKSFWYQLEQCAIRSFRDLYRNPSLTYTKMIIMIYISLLLDGLFHGLDNDEESILTRNGVLFFMTVFFVMVQVLLIVTTFPITRAVFIKEYAADMYGVLPFFLSRNIVDLIDEVFTVLLTSCLTYWVIGLNNNSSEKFFIFCKIYTGLIVLLTQMAGTSMGYLCGCLFTRVDMAVSLSNVRNI